MSFKTIKTFSTKEYAPFGLKFDGEGFYFKGNSADDRIAGTNNDDHLSGGAGDDHLKGNAGNDLLNGGAGDDFLKGGAGVDTFVFSQDLSKAGVDTIKDFNSKVGEKIMLNAYVFEALEVVPGQPVDPDAKPIGTLAASNFFIGVTAQDADDRLIYDQAKGALYYDADGNGSGAAILFAQLKAGAALTAENIIIF